MSRTYAGGPPHPALERLLDLPRFGDGTGLHRVARIGRGVLTGEWAGRLDSLRVTGSNGKGSVVSMAAAMLRRLGVTTGTFTSPHLLRFEERIQLQDEPVPAERLGAAAERVWAEVARCQRRTGERVGRFEAVTALALECFEAAAPHTLVVEADIGGRFDPTRLIPGRSVALTSVDLEHAALLGPTLELIALDKADLCPPGGTLIAGVLPPGVAERLRVHCRLREVRLVETEARWSMSNPTYAEGRMMVDLHSPGLSLPRLELALTGRHQARNAVVAIELVRDWLRRDQPGAERSPAFVAAVREGLRTVRWPGRLERVHSDPEVYVDVGHTPAAMDALAATVREALAGRRILLLAGVSRDKNAPGVLGPLAAVAERALCTRAHHQGRPAGEVAALLREARPGLDVEVEEPLEAAVARALEVARRERMTVLAAGGLFLAMEAAYALRGGDPRELRFG